jgi:hypothetical protein
VGYVVNLDAAEAYSLPKLMALAESGTGVVDPTTHAHALHRKCCRTIA